MGQKVSPIGLRVGVIRDWESRWYAEKDYADFLLEDVKIREFLFKELKAASVSKVEIERSKNRVDVIIKTARPGMVIGGNGGEVVEALKKKLVKLTGGKNVFIKVMEIANPDLDAKLVARSIADQLENRASFRTAQKKAIQRTMRAGAKGIKTAVSGLKKIFGYTSLFSIKSDREGRNEARNFEKTLRNREEKNQEEVK